MRLIFLLFIFVHLFGDKLDDHVKSPYNQNLPDCLANNYKNISKKTRAKAILCPMIKDEVGFLSEWVAYYQVHGFDHIMIFDDQSTDGGLHELQPWIASGFVSVVTNWTTDSLNLSPAFMKNEFKKNMAIKALLEAQCKLKALQWGYDLEVSLDLDEYIIPDREGETVVDELIRWMNATGRSAYCMTKLNFPSTPHILEPVNLLTIEAYQTRMKQPSKMNYYTSVSPKCAYKLRSLDFTNISSEFVANCCHFHGCEGHDMVMMMT